MSKSSINLIVFVIACGVLYFIAQNLVTEKKLPSLGDILASSTSQFASTTATIASTTAAIASTTTTIISSNSQTSPRTAFDFPSMSLFTPKGSVKVFIAQTSADREQGLSDIVALPQAVGVLFVFDTPGTYGFWMKGMHFPLDLIWIDSHQKIIGVTKNVLPSSYPFVFMPPAEVLYVIEMNAGSVNSFGLTTGTTLHFSL